MLSSRLSGTGSQKAQPSCVIIDTQSVSNAATAIGSTVGFEAGKLVKGRKRLVLIDTLGNLLASCVVGAGASDAATAIGECQPPLIERARPLIKACKYLVNNG